MGWRGGYDAFGVVVKRRVVETVEEVDRLALRHPEGPRVVLLEAQQPRGAEQRFEEEPRKCDPGSRHEHHRSAADSGETALEAASSKPTGDDARGRQNQQRHHDPDSAERDADYEQRRPQHAERGQADEVPEPREP